MSTKEIIAKRNEKAGPKVVEALKKRGFDAWYCPSAAEARDLALTLIPEGDVVSWGGALSAVEAGLIDAIREKGYALIDRDTAKTQEEREELMRQALLCDTFIGGANALSADGQIVNIDGHGNRVAAMTFGPKSVIVLASMKKVMPDLDSAMKRARGVAAPANLQRFAAKETPCQKNGLCADCLSPDSICNYFQVIRRCAPAGKIKVILVGEDLGL